MVCLMFSQEELLAHLVSRFNPRAVILYGSAVSGELISTSDIDVVCFVEGEEQYPELDRWHGLALDVWVHPLKEAASEVDFLKLHNGHILLDYDGIAHGLLQRVAAQLLKPPAALDARHARHRNAWVWKMFDRARRGGVEGDHRRHWLLYDLLETWCEMRQHHYLGPANALKTMKRECELTYLAIERALKPGAALHEIEAAIVAVVGERPFESSSS